MTRSTFHVRSLHGGAITAVDARSGRSFARHTHDDFGVGLVTRGAQRSWSGRGQVEAIRGNLITVNPAEVHDGAPIGQERAWSMLYFSQRVVESVVTDLCEGKACSRELHAPVVDDTGLSSLFIATRTAALGGDRNAVLEERLLTLFGRLFNAVPRAGAIIPHRLAHVRERIDDDPAHPHPLAELAAMADLSRFQTVRAFTRLTGFTPHAYVTQRRLDTARQVIRDGSTLADAAAAAGFADQSHMHRLFSARYGFTPGAYAAAHQR